MTNPYRGLPAHQFWRGAVAGPAAEEVDPIVIAGFGIAPDDRIATAGSCFAQHIARTLAASGYHYFVTEQAPATSGAEPENYGTFSARFGNIYSVRQLLQLFRRAYATFEPVDRTWTRADGRLIDPFRPQIQAGGWADGGAMLADRDAHFAAVRAMFEECSVFIFTLGLTEAWQSTHDGATFPIAPGVVADGIDAAEYAFHNFTVAEMEADLAQFVTWLRGVNPQVRVILTVSPVALVATYEPRHVLVSTTYSKAALRVVADQVARRFDGVDYFPSYEMITGPHTRGAFWADDLREVRPEGVAYVMRHFARHYLRDSGTPAPKIMPPAATAATLDTQQSALRDVEAIICDEEVLDRANPAVAR